MTKYWPSNPPSNFLVTSGCGRSDLSELSAFDIALNDAGIADYNLLKISSILPANAKLVNSAKLHEELPKASALLTAYGAASSSTPGTVLGTAVAVGVPTDSSEIGVIMETHYEHLLDLEHFLHYEDQEEVRAWLREHAVKCVQRDLTRTVERAVADAMHRRNIRLDRIITSATAQLVEADGDGITSLISAVCIW